jgi:hypothetical protein
MILKDLDRALWCGNVKALGTHGIRFRLAYYLPTTEI